MKVIETKLDGLLILEPSLFGDSRGYFFECYNQKVFSSLGITNNFVQDNESYSKFGTLRGLHFQKNEYAQAKLVRASVGSVLDVVVDMRRDSSTFGEHLVVELTSENKRMLFIPRGFAHGFVVLSDFAIFSYKCDNFYSPENEGGIIWNDPTLKIDWRIPTENLIISNKDLVYPQWKEMESSI